MTTELKNLKTMTATETKNLKIKLNKYLEEAGIQLSPACINDINRLEKNKKLYKKFVNSLNELQEIFNADISQQALLIHAFCVYFIYLNDTDTEDDSKDIVYNFELSYDGWWDDKCEYAKDYFASGDFRYTEEEIKEMGWKAYADLLLSSDVWEYNNFYFLICN
jgi:hypothetical protein